MKRLKVGASLVLAGLLWARPASAEHFNIDLSITAAGRERTSSAADTNTPARQHGFKPRPIAHAKVGEEFVLQIMCSSNFPHNTIKKVTIRYFVAPEAKAGQDAVPSRDTAVTQGEFVMDFKPETGKVGIRQRMKIEKAGAYLVRIESENSDSDHEHFSALDLVVE